MGYSISQAAEMLDITKDTLRYYEKEGIIPHITRNEAGNREYTKHDIDWINDIQCFKKTGMPLKDLKDLIQLTSEGDETIDERISILEEHRKSILSQMDELESYLLKIDKKINYIRNGC